MRDLHTRRTIRRLALLGLVTASCSRPPVPVPAPAASRQITYTFTVAQAPDSATVEVYVPPTVGVVRAVVAFIARSVDQYAFDDRDWRAMCARADCALVRIQLPGLGTKDYEPHLIRDAAAGGGAALLRAMNAAAAITAHPELANARLILFGHSAAGSFVVTFASLHADRVLGLIRYHSVPVAVAVDSGNLASVAALTIVGARDAEVGTADSRTLWHAMRLRDARWAYVSHLGQPHFSVDGLIEAGPLMRDWVEGIVDRSDAGAKPRQSGWLVDGSWGGIAPDSSFRGARAEASWVPNIESAFELERIAGVCGAATLSAATQVLGPSARVISESIYNCHYATESVPTRDLFLALARTNSAGDALRRAQPARQRTGFAITSLGDGASFSTFQLRQQQCGSVIAARLMFLATASLCGPGFGATADTATLNPIVRRLLGVR